MASGRGGFGVQPGSQSGEAVFPSLVVTGFAGQLSLAQFALAGFGALIAGRLAAAGVPYEFAIVAAGLSCIPMGVALGVAGSGHICCLSLAAGF